MSKRLLCQGSTDRDSVGFEFVRSDHGPGMSEIVERWILCLLLFIASQRSWLCALLSA